MTDDARMEFERLLAETRPKLHRYCARMAGSAVEGEDIVQDAMMKAIAALPEVGHLDNPVGWLFRIAHNTALDFLRQHARAPVMQPDEDLIGLASDTAPEEGEEIAAVSLSIFLRLPALQRSAVILKDVLGHDLEEVTSITGVTPAAAKSALQRGRERLRAAARESQDIQVPTLSADMQVRLTAYVEGFRTGDFDAVRRMLADEVKLDLVGKLTARAKDTVSEYYGRYAAAAARWAYAAGVVDGRPAMLVFNRQVGLTEPAYFVSLTFKGDRVVAIHDFLFAPYAMEGISLSVHSAHLPPTSAL